MPASSAVAPKGPWMHPSPHLTRLDAFRRSINRNYGLNLTNYTQLHKWSVDEIESFCREIWTFCGLVYSKPPTAVAVGIESMWPRPRWFPDAQLNYTENILIKGLAAHPDAVAVSACREGGTRWRHLTWIELRRQVALYTSALRQAGVKQGDRVATVATNSIESLLILLAAGAIGAIFSSTAPDMGAKGIVERYSQIQPKILFLESTVLYGGKTQDQRKKLKMAVGELKKRVKQLERVVIITGPAWDDTGVLHLNDFLNVDLLPLEFTQLPFDHPIYILYSSGTTGPPKCICHAGGAVLLQQKKDLILGAELGEDSTYYQYTTIGWMMWNMLVAALSLGSRIVLYDGSPLHPSPAFQVQLLDQQGVTHWGTSPKFLTTLRHSLPGALPPLQSLQVAVVSGAPLPTETSDWFYAVFPKQVALQSSSGGTDLAAGIVGGNLIVPLHGPQLAAPTLGMQVEIWDQDGRNIENSGQKGDLVITKPFFSMPVTFWGEGGHEKYRKAYFDVFPGIWCHGDFISKDLKTHGYVIHGRSDGVLNPGGVRFGTADLYNVVHKFPQVEECIAVGQRRPKDNDERVLLFLKMRDNTRLEDSLRADIAKAIRKDLSGRHVPAYMFQVRDIPYTSNGKKIENLVRDIVCGEEVKVGGTATNPECLKEYEAYLHLPLVEEKAKL
ncbi:related to acetoacetyl-CoA synthetase [Fusarium torulosum]|uniref:Related to acetoacetyl-CoA synthetase n=1 Tax=Fusarium torulosum TaxID=33205 RepID=A0AAE8MCP1_9HYPO|nr:related to acetoacetyl-CoA synthetase [Fusarium torulosum]